MTGEVTVPGGVWMEGERRGAAVYAPGGYHWVPARGERVLVLKAGESGEEPCVMGRVPEERGLRPGEVLISTGKAEIRLGLDGCIDVTGTFRVNGTVVGPLPKRDEEDGGWRWCCGRGTMSPMAGAVSGRQKAGRRFWNGFCGS